MSKFLKVLRSKDWIEVTEDLPQVDPQYTNREITIDVLCLNSSGEVFKGFYCYNINQWFDCSGNKKNNVKAWCSL